MKWGAATAISQLQAYSQIFLDIRHPGVYIVLGRGYTILFIPPALNHYPICILACVPQVVLLVCTSSAHRSMLGVPVSFV